MTCLVDQAAQHNLALCLVVNRFLAHSKAKSYPVMLINTSHNISIRQSLLTELSDVEFYSWKYNTLSDKNEDNIKIGFQQTLPDHICFSETSSYRVCCF